MALMKHVWDCPNEWLELEEAQQLNLPEHYPEADCPAYFINARHAVGTQFAYSILSPLLREKMKHMDARRGGELVDGRRRYI